MRNLGPAESLQSVDDRPVEASSLPITDKPVTLSFKGGASVKQAPLGVVQQTGPVKRAVPLSNAFSAAEGLEADDATASDAEHQKNSSEDPKGWSHGLVADDIASRNNTLIGSSSSSLCRQESRTTYRQ